MAKTMHVLTRDEILAALDHRTETVEVPEWGGSVLVRSLSGSDRDRLEGAGILWEKAPNGALAIAGYQTVGTRARLVAAAVVDEAGNLLFTPADVEALGAKDSAPLDRIADVATRISGMGPKANEEAKAALKAIPAASNGSS
jgi:hypothetical protein